MKAQRRPKAVSLSAETDWQRDREFEMRRAILTGLGIRPEPWWALESGRPDLAAGAGDDPYAHLGADPVRLDRAQERLRHLVTTGELTAGERAAIAAGSGPRHAWRQEAIR